MNREAQKLAVFTRSARAYAIGCAVTEALPATDLERSIVATVRSIAELCARTVT